MSGLLNDYLSKRLSVLELQTELKELLNRYQKHTGRFLFLYAASMIRPNIDTSLSQEDFYTMQDVLRDNSNSTIDFYIETPGGSGEAAEEIAKFLHKKFDEVNFIIAGEAKSAGTILVLSGDNIFMTETGSLGPIDAQIRIGRMTVSAYDYVQWLDNIRKQVNSGEHVNEVDAIIIAQISPGEINGIINALEYAKDLVKEWLVKYKFKNWVKRESTGTPVTEKCKALRAGEIAEFFCNHEKWRSHARSLKREDLDHYLIIENIDNDQILSEIVYRIKAVLRLIFDGSTIYKIFCTDDFCLNRSWIPKNTPPQDIQNANVQNGTKIDLMSINVDINCPKCNKLHRISGFMHENAEVIKDLANNKEIKPKNPNLKDNIILICDSCKFEINLDPVRNQIETQERKSVIFI
jgi:hypothetical protein